MNDHIIEKLHDLKLVISGIEHMASLAFDEPCDENSRLFGVIEREARSVTKDLFGEFWDDLRHCLECGTILEDPADIDEATKAAQRARDRGDDPETVAYIERDTREVLRARHQGKAVGADVADLPEATVGNTTLRLVSDGYNKVAVIKVVKDAFGMGLAEAKELVESAPVTLYRHVSRQEADDLGKQIKDAGGIVEIDGDGEMTDEELTAEDERDVAERFVDLSEHERRIVIAARPVIAMTEYEERALASAIAAVASDDDGDDARTVTEFCRGISKVQGKTQWTVSSRAARKPVDLSFVSNNGRMGWWNVTPPNTDYCHAHEVLGRAYAFEFLDMINNPDKDEELVHDSVLSFVARGMWEAAAHDYRHGAIADGFWRVIGEYLLYGTADR